MATTIGELLCRLEASGVIGEESLSAARTRAGDLSADGEDFLRLLHEDGELTAYQARAIWNDEGRRLVLGNYVVEDEIGRGGMGVVFKARHRRMKRHVAIKVLPEDLGEDPDAIARFHRELEAAGRLNHANIVTAYDADEIEGLHFLAMEFVDGCDLGSLVKAHGVLSPSRAVDLVIQAAQGLAYAHSQGVIHRDVKPANLLLDSHGVVRVLDLGLARLEVEQNVEVDSELTGTGRVMGTIDYMAPEQAVRTRDANARSDIYSLGCTLYYLLTSRPVYVGESVVTRIVAHREEPIPSLVEANPLVPQSVNAVFRRMVAKSPEDRFQSMPAVIAALESTIVELPDRFDRASVHAAATRVKAAEGEETGKTTVAKASLPSPKDTITWSPIEPTVHTETSALLEDRGRVVGRFPVLALGLIAVTVVAVGVTWWNSSGNAPEADVPRQEDDVVKSGWNGSPPSTLDVDNQMDIARDRQLALSTRLGEPVVTENSVGMELALIPAGTFTMGSDGNTSEVTLTKHFRIGVYEVTQSQWTAVMGGNKWNEPGAPEDVVAGDALPATHIRARDSTGFCWKLTDKEQREGRLADDWEYRLPTEAEWEYACRAGTDTTYSFGDDVTLLGGYAWYGGRSGSAGHPGLHEVGQKKPNAWGLFDVHGNVREWCMDFYSESLPRGIDPQGPTEGEFRISRGGSWADGPSSANYIDSATRFRSRDFPSMLGGFRVVLSRRKD